VDEQLAALSAGADDVLLRPFHPDLLRIRVRNMLRQKTVLNQLEQTESILFALAQAVEKRDQGTGRHCERIAIFSVALGMSLALPRTHLLALYRGGYLHDIGKVAVPDAILFKQGSLSPADWEVMRGHTVKGEEICGSLKTLSPVLPIIRSHHERWDGSGYPDGLRGPAIPLLARILQMADIYDALTCARPYKAALSPEHALSVMQQETERGWRDPDMMELFRRMNHRAVAEAAEQNATAWQDVDSIRSSLTNLARHIGEGRWIATV
jgi:putative two-component system response regulator